MVAVCGVAQVAATYDALFSGWHMPALKRDHYCTRTAYGRTRSKVKQSAADNCSCSAAVRVQVEAQARPSLQKRYTRFQALGIPFLRPMHSDLEKRYIWSYQPFTKSVPFEAKFARGRAVKGKRPSVKTHTNDTHQNLSGSS